MVTTIGSRAVWKAATRECFSASVEITVVRRDAQDSVTMTWAMATTRSSVKLVSHENPRGRCSWNANRIIYPPSFSEIVTSNLSSPQSNIRWFERCSEKRGDRAVESSAMEYVIVRPDSF